MAQSLFQIALIVGDYDEALDFYAGKLGFEIAEDSDLGGGKRWVVVRPPGSEAALLLARAGDAGQAAHIGRQGGGRVFLFLKTDDFAADHARMSEAGVTFLEAPRTEPHGQVAVFEDLYGNRWDLIEPAKG